MKGEVRRAAVAGSFYPGGAQELSRQIRAFLSQAPPCASPDEVVGLVSPHAGYMYSGLVAAHAFKAVEGMKFDAVVVIAPSHRARFRGASIYDRGGFETPLGVVRVDQELCPKIMAESKIFHSLPQAHAQEHSLEVQLPFLQEVIGTFALVPILIMDQSYETCAAAGEAIARAVSGKRILLVASTDLSHYHSYDEAVRMDQSTLDDIARFDPRALGRDLDAGKGEACGGGPVMAVMAAARELGASRSVVLKYLNSGDVTGDRSEVVGYAAAAFLRAAGKEKKEAERRAGVSLGLTGEEKTTLLEIARSAIEKALKNEKATEVEISGEHLKENRGAFVSLHRRGRLRGCIGTIQPSKPLYQVIGEMAAAAAFDDSRFEPLGAGELKDLEIEISVLTPLERMKDIGEIEIGRHGLYVKKGFYSGLLLPQVATDFSWDRETFLQETCRKAGLPKDAWKDRGTEIYLFSADIF